MPAPRRRAGSAQGRGADTAGVDDDDLHGNPLTSAFAAAAGAYALVMAAGVVLCIVLAVSGPAFSIDTPLFSLQALNEANGKHTSFDVNVVPFLLASAGAGAAWSQSTSGLRAARARRRAEKAASTQTRTPPAAKR